MAGKYEHLKVIGRGTFGLAWLTRSKSSQRLYVVKEIRLAGMTEKDRNQAVNEVAILAGLKHVNVVRYREAYVEEGTLHIAMEYADGGDLSEVIKVNRQAGKYLSEDQLMNWFVQICFALNHIHAKKILHRDLKPQNIFVTSQGIIKVGDFGIARMLHDTKDHAHTAIGTPYYISPEICQRKPYNQKSDMWAAGCVLYEMTSLVHPFEANDFSSLVMKILRGRYRAIPRHYGPLLEDMISVLLRVDPERRPTADQLLSIPGIQRHVLAYTHRCKDRSSSPATPRDRRSQNSHRGFESDGSRVREMQQDSTVTSRRHSTASVAGSDRADGVLSRSLSVDKDRRHSAGVRVADRDCAQYQKMIGSKNLARKSSITGGVDIEEKCAKTVPSTYRQHRVASTSSIAGKERPRSVKAANATGESVRFPAWKQRSFSVDVVGRTPDKGTITGDEAILAKASRDADESTRKHYTPGKTESCIKSCLEDSQMRAPTACATNVRRKSSIAVEDVSLKKSTYVLEGPSAFVTDLGVKERNTRSAITKCILHIPETCDGTPGKIPRPGNSFGVGKADEVEGSTNGQRSHDSVRNILDNFDQWEKTGERGLLVTVMEKGKLPGREISSDFNVDRVRANDSRELLVRETRSQTEGQDEKNMIFSEINECLFQCRVHETDSAREVRGKIETLRVYLEDNIGVEASLACLNLVKSATGGKKCSVMQDRLVLGKMEELLGKDRMAYVPVVLHLHNLEESCNWLPE